MKKLKSKTNCGTCMTYSTIGVSIVLSAKYIELLFSNLFESTYFVYKVSDKIKFTPINYTRYASLLLSVIAVIGAGIANYERQTQSLSSLVYIQSVDLIIVTMISFLASIWCTIRKASDYENVISDVKNGI